VVTLGARGALAATRDALWMLPAAAVAVVDTTGAGDAFLGAYAAAVDRGAGMAERLGDAIAAGSHACTRAGAQSAMGERAAWTDAARELASQAHRTIR
jgi:ribokinase